jgi:uncharacterized protein DUF2569
MAATSQHDAPRRVGGWLLVLCRLLIVLHPLSLAVTASNVMNALFVRGAPVAIVLLMRLAVVAFGVAAGRMLQNVRPGAVELARVALLASAALDVFVYTTPFFPSNRMPGDTTFYLIASLAYHGVWIAYLARSKRVRTTFG